MLASEAILSRLKMYASWIAACVAAILAYFSGFELISNYFKSQDDLHLAANIYVVSMAAIVVLFSMIRQWVTIRRARYANIAPALHHVHHQIRDLITYMALHKPKNEDSKEYDKFLAECRIMFSRVLDQLKIVFSSITSTHCRVALKMTYLSNKNEICLAAITRDQSSNQRCLKMDAERAHKDHDPLKENPHYRRLFEADEVAGYYFSNNLVGDREYSSTSFSAYNPSFGYRPPRWRWPWNHKWLLPYKSKVACVIRQPVFDLGPDKPDVLGLLILDSESRGVFVERWDVQLMFAAADALYMPVSIYVNAHDRHQELKRGSIIPRT